MVEVPDYSFISKDTGPSLSQSIGNWQGITKNALEIQDKQADTAWGNALQQATDAQGNVDIPKARALAAKDPMARQGMLRALPIVQTQETNAYDLHTKRIDGAMGAMGQLIADNPAGVPADAAHKVIDDQHALGRLTDQEAQAMHGRVSNDPQANTQLVLQGMSHALSAKQALDAAKPPPRVENIGGQIVTVQPSAQGASSPTPSLGQGTGGVQTGMDPNTANQIVTVQIGNNQSIQTTLGQAVPILQANPNLRLLNPNISLTPPAPAAHGFTPYVPPASRAAPTAPAAAAPSTSPRGTPGGPGTYQGGGFGVLPAAPGPRSSLDGGPVVASADPAFAPSVGAAAPPSPAVAGDVAAIMAGRNRARATPGGGTQTAFNALQGGGAASTPAPGQPPATASPAPNVPLWRQPPPPPVQGGGAGGLGVTAAPGYIESQKKIADASTAAYNGLQAQAAATKDIEPILSDMEAQAHTPGFETGMGSIVSSTMRQLLQFSGLTPREPGGKFDVSTPEAAKEQFAKDAARLQAAQLGALGNPTDARQELSESTNPGLMLSKYGNLGIIHMLQGNQQAIRAMSDAWGQATQAGWTPDQFNTWMSQRFLARDGETGGRFDPRVFWFANEGDLTEQRKYAANIPEGVQRRQFLNNLQYAKNMGWIRQNSDGSAVVTGP